jgi:cytochrome c5
VNLEDKQFMMQFMIVLGVLMAFTVVIFFLARFLMHTNKVDYRPLAESEIEERVQPVGEVSTGKVAKPAPKAAAADATGGAQASGQQTYAQVCAICHDTGTAGAPKVTDKAAWQPRIKQGKQTLYQHAINGLGAMPPKGGQASLSDAQVEAAVDYIVAQVSGGAAGAQQQPSKAPAAGGGQKPAPPAEKLPGKKAPTGKQPAAGAGAGGGKQ